MLGKLVCPISNVRIDRNVVRVNGFITTLLLLLYVYTRSPWFVVPIGLDYVLRAQMDGPASPMARLAQLMARALGVPYRALDKAPKVFASRIGACFAMGAATAHFAAPAVAPWVAGTLAVFTMLESVFDLCVGCVVYTYVALPLYRAREAVRAIPLFGRLEDQMLVAVANGFRTVRIPEGTRVVTEGEEGNEMFMVCTGRVEVYRDRLDGGETVLATYERGQFFGEMAILSGAPRNASVRAVTPVLALKLLKSELEAMLRQHPGMRELLEQTAAQRMAREESLMVE